MFLKDSKNGIKYDNFNNTERIYVVIISIIASIFIFMLVNYINSYKISLQEEEIENLDNEINKLNDSVKLKENEIFELDSEIESIIEIKEEKENEVEKLKEKVKSKDNNINELENRNEKLKEELLKYDNLRKLNIVATAYEAYCDTCGQWGGITATGYDISNTVYKNGYRVIAVDPKVIPLGSLLYIETKGMSFVGIADDTGGAIKGNRIDILMENRKVVYDFGVQGAKVTILREGK